MKKSTKAGAIALGTAMLAVFYGCSSLKVESTADLSYTKTIHKIYIIAELPRTPEGELLYLRNETTLADRNDPKRKLALSKAYAMEMEKDFNVIGIQAKCELPTGLELDDSATDKQIASFAPDAILIIDCVEITLKNSRFSGQKYDFSLYDYPSHKRVWRAKYALGSSTFPENLARKLQSVFVTQLKKDNMNILGTIEK